MTDLRAAAQQALEALESAHPKPYNEDVRAHYEAIAALRTALAQPEPRNQCGETCERATLCAVCARGLAQQEQEPVAWANINKQGDITHTSNKRTPWSKTPLYTHPPRRETEQEPVAWGLQNDEGQVFDCIAPGSHIELSEYNVPLYTHPPRREWRGLTEEDIALIDWESMKTKRDAARAIEQALKEKNHE